MGGTASLHGRIGFKQPPYIKGALIAFYSNPRVGGGYEVLDWSAFRDSNGGCLVARTKNKMGPEHSPRPTGILLVMETLT